MNTKSLIFLSSTVLFFIVFVFGHIYWSGPSYGFDAITYSFYSLLLAIGTVFLLPKVHENLTHDDFNVRLKLLYKFTFIISLTLVLYLYYLTWLDLSSDTYTHQSGLWHLTTYKDFGGGGYSKLLFSTICWFNWSLDCNTDLSVFYFSIKNTSNKENISYPNSINFVYFLDNYSSIY